MNSSDIITIAEGLCYKSVCVPKDTAPEEIEAAVGPSGTSRGWRISEDTHFRTGETNPCPCDQEPGRTHYLMDC